MCVCSYSAGLNNLESEEDMKYVYCDDMKEADEYKQSTLFIETSKVDRYPFLLKKAHSLYISDGE
jgi:hypothetical protein